MGEKKQAEEIKTPKNSQGHRGDKEKRPTPCAIFQKSGGWPNQDTNRWSTGGSSVEGPQAAGQPSPVLTAVAVEGGGSPSAGQPSLVLTAGMSLHGRTGACGSSSEHAEQCKHAHRAANNAARKAVMHDKCKHWREKSQKLEILSKKAIFMRHISKSISDLIWVGNLAKCRRA